MTWRYVRSETSLWRRTPTAVVCLPPGAEHPLTMRGPTALRIWDLLSAPLTVNEAIAQLRADPLILRSVDERDLTDLLDDLERNGLVSRHESP